MESLRSATLRSERARVVFMMAVLSFGVLIGVWRLCAPGGGGGGFGPALLGTTVFFLAFELGMFVGVCRAIRAGEDLRRWVWFAHGVIEVLLPITAIVLLMSTTEFGAVMPLISPAVGFLFVVMALSVLRLDPAVTLVTCAVGAGGYVLIVCVVMARTWSGESLEALVVPRAMFFGMCMMPIFMAVLVTYSAHRLRQYVELAIREGQVQRELDQLERDLDLAREVQQSLLPAGMPKLAGYDVAAMSRPASQTGGDYYDWQAITEERVVISLADVAGHGVGPAMVTAACRAYARATIHHSAPPDAVVRRVNELLHNDMPAGRFVTFALLDLDASSHRGVFLAAGHGPSLHIAGETGEVTSIGAQGLPMGLYHPTELEAAVELRFEAGDVVVIMSDGFFEWANGAGEQFGIGRIGEVIRAHRRSGAGQILEAMDQAARSFVGEAKQSDDMTAVVVKRVS